MGFDKIKAMRNAEKFLAQGKIKAAIGEYKQIVDNDPRDYGTMNLLGDLYTKAEEPKSALKYYTTVAEHYGKQGFSQKAIAVYNKINRIQPNSIEVSEKLAELYKTKGSVTEAKSHYVLLAENYQAKGRTVEALAMWKQIALLDPANTEVYVTIAETYLKEEQTDEAVDAFTDAGDRFLSRAMVEQAEAAYLRGLELRPVHSRCLTGYVNALASTGRVQQAAEKLEAILAEFKGNREVLYALIDCYLEAGEVEKAEKVTIKLVEQEPANYPKFLHLANHYLTTEDFAGASRMLTMASDHMLAGGQAEEFANAVRRILDHEPDNLDAVRLLVRFCTWQRDEDALKGSLRRLADLSREQGSVDDERFALSQIVMLMPQEADYAARLRDLNAEHGFEDDQPTAGQFDLRFLRNVGEVSNTQFEGPVTEAAFVGAVIESSNGEVAHFDIDASAIREQAEIETFEASVAEVEVESVQTDMAAEVADDSPEALIKREVDSIRFYIDSGYTELAEKAIEEFRGTFGDIPEADSLTAYLNGSSADAGGPESLPVVSGVPEPAVTPTVTTPAFDMDDFRSELGLEEPDAADDSDFETKYQTAVAYQEMGLLEQAIAEFQDACGLVSPNDGTRRFFNCANLLGLCFMANGMPKLAQKWYERALEVKDLNSEEKQALWYELGIVYEAEGNQDEAGRFFEQVYAENVDFRDVSERIRNMAIAV